VTRTGASAPRTKGPGALVIGCGNADRGDDAAGLLVARRLRELGVEAQEQSGDAAGLLDIFESAPEGRRIILVDAMVTGSPPGFIHFWDAGAARLSRDVFRCSTHALGVVVAAELARVLGKLPSQVGIYGIEGAGFEAGAPPSPEVLRAVEELAQRIAREV
jgi:hydrogenase maturation protease